MLLDYILALGKQYAYASRASCFYIEINILNIFNTKYYYITKSTVFHSGLAPVSMPPTLLEACRYSRSTILLCSYKRRTL